MFQKLKRFICLILVSLLIITNTDMLRAEGIQPASLSDDEKWEYTIPENPEDGVTITGYRGSDKEILIPDTLGGYSVKTIATDAFLSGENLTSITISKEVNQIYPMAFSGAEKLENIYVSIENQKYYSVDGILYCKEEENIYHKNACKLVCCPPAKKAETVTIPDNVELISTYAFYKCTGIGNVVIGDHVTTIEYGAFYNSSMKNLTLGSGLLKIETQAFGHCRQLEKVSISGEMRPSEEWNMNPFYDCPSLKEIFFEGDSDIYTLKDGVLFGNSGKRLLTYPPMKEGETYIVPDCVEEIADYAFSGSRYLKHVELPQNLKKIGMGAFAGAHQLQSVTGADQLQQIGADAFFRCFKLETFELSDTLEQIGSSAFKDCSSLSTPLVFPSCLQFFGEDVFNNCDALEEITFLAQDFTMCNYCADIPDHTVIKGYKDSSAENYAKLCGKIFVDLETGKRTDYSYTTQMLLDLLPVDFDYGEPVSGVTRGSVAHEYDVSNEKYIGLKNFTDNLVKDCTTDEQRMSEILKWVHKHITYRFGYMAGADIDSVYRAFYSDEHQGNCEVYAQLTAYMLYLEGIPCVLLGGNGHQWCGAYSRDQKQWYMVDSTNDIMGKCGTGFFASDKIYENPTLNFSSGGMVFTIRNTTGIELVSFAYGDPFYNNTTELTIPDYVKSIRDGIFEMYGLSENFLIRGKMGTCAEKYVKAKGYECIQYYGDSFTACKKHKEKEIRNEATGIYQIICERCSEELESGKFLNQPEITSLTDSDAGVMVVWEKVAHAEKYRIYRKWCEDPKSYEWKLLGETSDNSFLDNSSELVQGGGTYYYTVQAVAEGVESPYHSYLDNSGPYVVCKPGKAEFHAAAIDNDGIHLYWASASGRHYTGVEIYRSVNGGAYEKISPSIEDITWDWLDTTADKTKCNTYYLRAYNRVKGTVVYGENSAAITVADLTNASIELSQSSFSYNGGAQTPAVTVRFGDVELKEGVDYTVFARNNVNAGTATLTITGKGFVSGSQTKSYTIQKANASLTAKADKTTIDTNGRTMVRPSGFWDGDCSFQSSDETIATVTAYGLVTGVSSGEVTITVTSEDTANCASGSASVTITIIQGACVHNYECTETVPADCTTPEIKTYTCTKCTESYTAQTGKRLGHDYQETVIAATCTTNGYTNYQCSRCNDEYRQKYVPASGHKYGEGEETKKPTCETKGEITYHCLSCTEERIVETAATGHRYDDGYMLEPATCISTGLCQYKCLNCGSDTTEIVAKTDHTFGRKFVYPTCTTDGYYCNVCYDCGTEKDHVSYGKAYGHNFSEGESVIITEATCTKQGELEQSCKRCGETKRISIPILAHDYREEIIKEVTCTEEGEKIYTCSVCGTTKTEITEPLRHSYKMTAKQATCTEAGNVTFTCEYCGDSYQDSIIAAIGHDFELSRIIQPTTCEIDGKYLYKCSHCGMDQDRTESAQGHDYLEEFEEVKATCQWEGTMVSYCRNCDKTKRRTVPKLPHQYQCMIVQEPSATEPGRKRYFCKCGEYYDEYFRNEETKPEDGPNKPPADKTDTPVKNNPVKNTIYAAGVTKVTKSGKQSFALKVTQTGNGKLSYSSSNSAVTINKSGKVTIAKNFVGKVTITIKSAATKNYQAATKKIKLQVNPAPVMITRVVNKNKRLVINWKKNAKATGYQVQYGTDKNFKSALKTVKIKKNKIFSYKSPKLKKGKTYYVRVRTYKNGCYSAWSKKKAVKIRK